MEEENKYHFAREIIFNLKACRAITDKVYLHWVDKLIEDENQAKNNESLHDVSHQRELLIAYAEWSYKQKDVWMSTEDDNVIVDKFLSDL